MDLDEGQSSEIDTISSSMEQPQADNYKYRSQRLVMDYLNKKKKERGYDSALLRKAIEEAIQIQNSVDRAIALINIISMARYPEQLTADTIWPLKKDVEDVVDIVFKILSEQPEKKDIERHVFACASFITQMIRLGLKDRLFSLKDDQVGNIIEISFKSAHECPPVDAVRLYAYIIQILAQAGLTDEIDPAVKQIIKDAHVVLPEGRVYLIPSFKFMGKDKYKILILDEFVRVRAISITDKPLKRAEAFIELIRMLVLAQETEQLSAFDSSLKNIIELAIESIDALNNEETKAKISVDLLSVLAQIERTENFADIDKHIVALVDIAYISAAERTDSETQVRILSYLTISLARAGFSQTIKQYGLLTKIPHEINNAVEKVDTVKQEQLRGELNQYFVDALYSLVYYWQPEEEKEINIDELRGVLQKIIVEL
ncbi:MAG: hypothetical protein KAJ14_05460, partial [Candidatus Omnitrophica bacterium]|nr:hypothetical protein [Candidatus Omnitrophota bacterium]